MRTNALNPERVNMPNLRRLIPVALSPALAASLLLAACSDATAPVADTALNAKRTKDFFTFAAATISDDSVDTPGLIDDAPANTLEQAEDAPALQTYWTSFTHTVGKMSIFSVMYQEQDGVPEPFLFLTIPKDAEFFDDSGKRLKRNSQVEITLEIDLDKFLVHFGPHGSTFLRSRPAELWFNYAHADLAERDPTQMTMWYQPSVGEEWASLDTEIDTFGYWARAEIYHFSNYAVAWSPFF